MCFSFYFAVSFHSHSILFCFVFVDILFCSDELWKQFLANSNENIHFALLMKPNKAFRLQCRRYPGLIGNTSIDYMRPWSEQVLTKVANVFLAGHPMIAENHLDGILKHVVHVHQSVHSYSARFLAEFDRLNFVTPNHYLEYIHTSIRLMGKYCWQHFFSSFSVSFFCSFSLDLLVSTWFDWPNWGIYCSECFIFAEEKNQYLAERCNRLSKAIFKCDELSGNLHQLCSLAQEQRDSMQLLKIKCKEMVENIEKSKWWFWSLFLLRA